ncbi:MAG: elongation factor 4 [Dehalococcoidia bacterium]|nr:elongation factor 4 [Dehalococcoidia bacterium]
MTHGERIRNFCIIAHIDHGKSTLADRLLELTGTVSARQMTAQFLDRMDLERERGITIKGKAVWMRYGHTDGQEYQLNLIDTPGHVDFSYEVSRALAACEGALLVVDATQGVQAQTMAHGLVALDHNLTLIPVVNKIDLPGAQPERVAEELEQVFGFRRDEILFISAKAGTGIPEVLTALVERVPPPKGSPESPLRALIFDSNYDVFKGVLAYVRVVDGKVRGGDGILMMGTRTSAEVLEVGVFGPDLRPAAVLEAGGVGYIATGLKNVADCRVGDTITLRSQPAGEPLIAYVPMKPMVFAGLYPAEGESFEALRDALEKLRLNDAALSYEPEGSPALGHGYRCGFLGLLHMEIVQERLEREYNLALVATAPGVAYQVVMLDGSEAAVANPAELPAAGQYNEIREPWLKVSVIVPSRFIGAAMDLASARRGTFLRMEYLAAALAGTDGTSPAHDAQVLLEYELPLAEILVDFYSHLKSRTQGYGSMDYSLLGYRRGDLVKLDIMLNNQPVDALSFIVHKDRAYERGRALVEQLRKLIPRQLFEVAVQAAIGSRVIARESIAPMRKNVLAKCYGGDVTRKRKLLEKQAEGKKRLKRVGRVEVPQEAFLALMKLDEGQ